MKRLSLICFLLLITCSQLQAQDSLKYKDPLRNYKMFSEMGITLNATRVNTEHTHFNTSKGVYDFKKNHYIPNLDLNINFGWLFPCHESSGIYTLKTGFNLISRSADLTDFFGNELRLSSNYLQIPVQVGHRFPMNYNPVKNGFYRAFELSAGLYAAAPFYQKLDSPDNIDSEGKSFGFNYIRFGVIAEISFSSLNSEGHGPKFGIRASTDFTSIAKIKETDNQLYPYYYSVGIFYNISNDYNKRGRSATTTSDL